MKVTDLKENEVIHCETEEQANAICKLMHEAGLTWCNGQTYLKYNNFGCYKEQTCYHTKEGGYFDLDFCKEFDYTIYKAEQFLNTKTMTKTRVLFEEVEEKKLKPIEFKFSLQNNLDFTRTFLKPKDYDEVVLITKHYADNYDVILAKKKDEEDVIYLGHWNDGVVE